MSRESRGQCAVCARVVHLRLDGSLRKHRDTDRTPCAGSETPPVARPATT